MQSALTLSFDACLASALKCSGSPFPQDRCGYIKLINAGAARPLPARICEAVSALHDAVSSRVLRRS